MDKHRSTAQPFSLASIRLLNHLALALSTLLFFACASERTITNAGQFAEQFCHIPPMVGEMREVVAGIEVHVDWVKNLEATGKLTHSESRKIQQELAGYSAENEQLHNSLEQACRIYAVCYALKESSNACSTEYHNKERAESEARQHYLNTMDRISRLDKKLGPLQK